MEIAIILVSIGFVMSMTILSVAYSYKLIVESNLKKKILAQESEHETSKSTITDDLQHRMEIFRRERFAPINSQRMPSLVKKKIQGEEKKNVP